MNKNVFLTGATGFLGSFLVKELLDKGHRIFALARGKGDKSAQDRIYDALRFVYEKEWNPQFISDNLKVIEGDIVSFGLGIRREEAELLKAETDIIIHSAALAELRVPLEVIRKVNVSGTRHVLDIALECQKTGRLKKVNHISTMYVCGDYAGEFDETMLDVGQKFHNTYEQSKFEAEILAREYLKRGLNISIFRPSMIMGDSKTGKTNNFRLFYQPLHFFANEIYAKFPADLSGGQNLINIDTVAAAIAVLLERQEAAVYHFISPAATAIKSFMDWFFQYFGYNLPNFIPAERFDFRELTPAQKSLAEPFAPYFNHKAKFIASATAALLEEKGFKYPDIDRENLNRVFGYCVESRFITVRSSGYPG